jgi:hypothetical protein
VRLQLQEEPAWARNSVVADAEVDLVTGEVSGLDLSDIGHGGRWINLLDEDGEKSRKAIMANKNVEKIVNELEEIGIKDVAQLLKIERGGEKNANTAAQDNVVADVKERQPGPSIVVTLHEDKETDRDPDNDATMAIEGYVPRRETNKANNQIIFSLSK